MDEIEYDAFFDQSSNKIPSESNNKNSWNEIAEDHERTYQPALNTYFRGQNEGR